MVQISPQNIAIASIITLVAGLAALGLVSAAIPSAEIILSIAGLVALVGYAGLFFAYYYAAVNVWDAGNRAGAVVFLIAPVVLAEFLALVSNGTIPLGEGFAYNLGYHIGLHSLILPAVGGAIALHIGSFGKRALKQSILHLPGTEPVTPPSSLALGAGTLILTVLLWAGTWA